MSVISVVIFKDINEKFVKGTVSLQPASTVREIPIDGNVFLDYGTILPVNLTDSVYLTYKYSPPELITEVGLFQPYLVVPEVVVNFDFDLAATKTGMFDVDVADLTSIKLGGVNGVIQLTTEITVEAPVLPTTEDPIGQATVYTAEKTTVVPSGGGSVTTTDIEFDYSEHFDRAITALEQISINLNTMKNNQEVLLASILNLSSIVRSSAESANRIAEQLNSEGGIPFKDIYGGIAYSSLIKLYREQGIDIDELINDTLARLRRLED